jgi:Glycosyltransferase 61
VDRPCGELSTRCLQNAPDVMRYLSQRFNISFLSFHPEQSRSEQLMNMLQQMASTDVLLGMHGAGLAHAAYLQPGTLMVEIKDDNMREKKLFLHMANKQDVGYYMYDAIPAARPGPSTILSDEEMETFTEDLWHAWEQELEYLLLGISSDPILKGECLFPRFLDTTNQSKLSSFDSSRCYLEQSEAHSNEWWQCTHYGECNNR